MPPTSEPTPADIAAVAQAINEPAPVATPVAPPQAAPQPQAQPQAQPQPQAPAQPAEPSDPFAQFAQPQEQPTEPIQPAEPAQPQEQPKNDYQSYEDYMNEVLKDVPQIQDTPDPNSVSPDDPESLKKFFDDLVNTAVQKASAEVARKSAVQAKERALWDEAFDKYGSIKTNKNLRDMVHNIRIGYFNRGIAITPKQAADKLLESLGNQYKQGVADNQVVTTIENVQPTAGGSGAPATTTLDRKEMLTAVQDGGEVALAEILDAQIKAGKL